MIKGKSISKIGMFLSVFSLFVAMILYPIIAKKIPSKDEAIAILLLCSGFVLFTSPIILSIWFSMFLKKSNSENKRQEEFIGFKEEDLK